MRKQMEQYNKNKQFYEDQNKQMDTAKQILFYKEQLELMDKENIRLANIKLSLEDENKMLYNELRIINEQLKKERDNFYISIKKVSIQLNEWRKWCFVWAFFSAGIIITTLLIINQTSK